MDSARQSSAPSTRLSECFARAKAGKRAALIIYLTAQDPDDETSKRLILAAAEAGADIVEIGVPWSDPSADGKAIQAAYNWIHSIVAEPEVGQIYQGTVVKLVDFGAFVNFFGSRDGLVHVSQLAPQRVAQVKDVVKEGDKVWVKLVGFDDRGKVRLSMKAVDQATGQEIPGADKGERSERRQEQAAG